MARMVTGGYEAFQKGLEKMGHQRTDGKKPTIVKNPTILTNEELVVRVKELEEKYSKLLEALPQIIKEELNEIGYSSKL